MGLRLTLVAVIVVALQVCPIRAAEQLAEEEPPPERRTKVVRVANWLLLAGVTFTALEHLHKRESCVTGTCTEVRRPAYIWGAGLSYSAAAVGYGIAIGNERRSLRISPRGVAAHFTW